MFQLKKKVRLKASLVFDTAWRVGSGKEGETMSDLGVMLTTTGEPILPGSLSEGEIAKHLRNSVACPWAECLSVESSSKWR